MDCLFCRIAAGEIPATVVARNEHALAFRDQHPQAPTHVLVIPIPHVASATDAGPETLGAVLQLAVEVATQAGLAGAGYRLVVNTGTLGGQTVDHFHVHLLGGRQMHWPPG